jgi:hypothetical protein
MPGLKSTFLKVDEEEFSWNLNLAIERCRSNTVLQCPVKIYDYVTTNPKHVGGVMQYSNKGPLPIRFDLEAFRKSGRKAVIFKELRFDAARDTYLKQKQELETDGFALTPPQITLLPLDAKAYTGLDRHTRPMSVKLADHGSLSRVRSNGNERFEYSIIRKLGSGSACGVSSVRVRGAPSEGKTRASKRAFDLFYRDMPAELASKQTIDLLCSTGMPAELAVDLVCSEDMPAELAVDLLCSEDMPAELASE